LVPVTERKRPSGPSAITLCWRDTLDAEALSSKESGRTLAYVYATFWSATRRSGSTLATAASR